MNRFIELLHQASFAVRQLAGGFERSIRIPENTSLERRVRLAEYENAGKPGIQAMQLAQHRKVQREIDRRSSLNDADLRLDLERQYGQTKWAQHLIDEMITFRSETRQRWLSGSWLSRKS